MHVHEPRDYDPVRRQRRLRQRRRHLKRLTKVAILLLVIVAVAAAALYLRPLPEPKLQAVFTPTLPVAPALQWPTTGQAAVGVAGQGVLATTANQTAVPTASVAKIMMALAVLKKYPLPASQTGPTLTMTEADGQLYNQYLALNGSVVQVQAGEQLTEYQALQAALLPSANNLADSLATWAYGSLPAYLTAANQLAQSLGMTQSHFAVDASGFNQQTVSTPHDLVLLGQAALQQSALVRIMDQTTADLPVVGAVYNVNTLLGQNGIFGIKTGNTDQAGGCYLLASHQVLANGQTITVITAVQGATDLGQALSAGKTLLVSFAGSIGPETIVSAHAVVGYVRTAWGKSAPVATATALTIINWRGQPPTTKLQTTALTANAPAGTKAGQLSANSPYGQAQVPLVLTASLVKPGWRWRIFHI